MQKGINLENYTVPSQPLRRYSGCFIYKIKERKTWKEFLMLKVMVKEEFPFDEYQ